MRTKILFVSVITLLVSLLSVVIADAQGPKSKSKAPRGGAGPGTAFTYQGQLKNNGGFWVTIGGASLYSPLVIR